MAALEGQRDTGFSKHVDAFLSVVSGVPLTNSVLSVVAVAHGKTF